VNRHHGALHINEIVFAQQLILSPEASNECAALLPAAQVVGNLEVAVIGVID
jgi:hypothetical protein